MDAEEYNWYIDLVKKRNHTLDLTTEQAEKIHWFEQDRDTFSDKHFLSVWEDADYELTSFREILNDDQFQKYTALRRESTEQYEKDLVEQDARSANGILYYEEMINFYLNDVLPDLLKDVFSRISFTLLEKNKVEFLKTEYRGFLNDAKKQILTNHFRHNRMFKPNELKESLLRHKLLYIIPDYRSFELEMDEPTKAVAEYLKTKFRYLPEEIDELIQRKTKEINAFHEQQHKKYYEPVQGWHTTLKENFTREEEMAYRLMMFLLLDNEKYGLR